MRADRLVAELLLLQARGRITAAELASELEISVPTARRDLEALAAAGVPVYPQPGRGGGWSLVGGARTDLTGLTEREATALFLLAGPRIGDTGIPAEAAAALRKLLRAIPAPFRDQASAAADALIVDTRSWGSLAREAPPQVSAIQDAIVRRRWLRVDYQNRSGGRRTLTVDPWALVRKDRTWYLIAAVQPPGQREGARHPGERRLLRLDRMASLAVLDTAAERPDGLDVRQAWDELAAGVDSLRSAVWASVITDERIAAVMREHFGAYATEAGPLPGQRVRLRVGSHTAASLAEQLAGWAAWVEVTEPPQVREELARIGARLVARYGCDGAGATARR